MLLLTSREDPFPSVVLEAMSAGVPTVAFEEAGSAPDLLRDLAAGVAVPLGDAAAMVRQLRVTALQTGPEQRARLARLARQRFPFADYADALFRLAAPPLPSVSAVVTTLNYAHYLPGRLSSVFGQSLAPLEILVLDDGSTDGSEAVVRDASARAGREVRWIGAEKPGGVFAQWRRAAARARGDFVWIAEADDLAEPMLLETVCAALQAEPDAAFGFADSRAIDALDAVLWDDHQAYYREAGAALLARTGSIGADRFLRACLGARNLVLNASAVVWRRDALREALARAGDDLAQFRLAGDWRLYAEALTQGGSVAYVAEPLNLHRRHAGGLSHRLDPARHLEEIKRMHRHMRRLLGDDPDLLSEQRRALATARRALKPAAANATLGL